MWKSLSHDDTRGFRSAPATPMGQAARPQPPSTMNKGLRHAAKTLQPYLKAMVAFASAREFQAKPSQYRLSMQEKVQGSIAFTPLFIGISAAFTEKNIVAVAIAIHDSIYLHDYSIHHLNLDDVTDDKDPIATFVVNSLREYEHIHLCKFIGGGVPFDLERISPSLCSKLWFELDLVPISLRPDEEAAMRGTEDFTFWHARGVDEQADSMARKCIMSFGPSYSPLLQIGYRGIVEIDAGFRSHMYTLQDYKNSCSGSTWDVMMKYADSLKARKTKIAFFSSTPQGGGVALMRHALVRCARTVGVDLRWYVPKPKPGVFRITKTVHNILQGVALPGVRITTEEKEQVAGWITEHAERYWLCRGGPLQPPADGGADVVIIDDPQMPSLIPLIKLITPDRPVLYRSHIQIRSDLTNKEGTPQKDVWDRLWSKIQQADMFISHPIPSFVPKGVPMKDVAYLPATTDWLDGLNKNLSDWDTQYYMNLYNQKAYGLRMPELEYPERQYIIQVARFDPAKGIPDVLKSYVEFRNRLFRKTGTASNTPQLLIVGNGSVDDPDGSMVHDQTMAFIEKHCPNLRASISVQRLEHNDQLLNTLISNAHIVLQLSIREGFEVKVSEALKKGRPVIATKVGGIPLQVQHGKNGFLVEPGDHHAVANYLMDLWTNKELHDQMSEYAARSVSDEVSTVGNALSWFYLADKLASGEKLVPDGKWVNDMARDEAKVPYGPTENRLPRMATAERH